jgi:hypothetical protein
MNKKIDMIKVKILVYLLDSKTKKFESWAVDWFFTAFCPFRYQSIVLVFRLMLEKQVFIPPF